MRFTSAGEYDAVAAGYLRDWRPFEDTEKK